MNYLTCTYCQHQNSILTNRVIFCEQCGKKLNNNFIDWKTNNSQQSFYTYVEKELVQKKTNVQSPKIESHFLSHFIRNIKNQTLTQSQKAVISFSIILIA